MVGDGERWREMEGDGGRYALTLVQSVMPCVMTGSPLSPSQQSSSTERQPCASTRAYISADEWPASWSGSIRYLLVARAEGAREQREREGVRVRYEESREREREPEPYGKGE